MKIGVLYSNFMAFYIKDFIILCNQNNINIDIFLLKDEEFPKELISGNMYKLSFKWNTDYNKLRKDVEGEIKNIVDVENYDYFISDVIGLPFKNACNIFHMHSINYKIEHTSSGVLGLIIRIGHSKQIEYESECFKNSKLCIVGSKEMKEDYNKNFNIPFENIKIIPPGLNNIEPKEKIKKTDKSYVSFGSVNCGFNSKGGFIILNALRILKKKYSPYQIQFKFINPNYHKQWYLKLYVKVFEIDKYVKFLPYHKYINDFYSKIDYLICVSKSEAFGRVVTEAMNFGIPVIVASNVGASDVVKDGVNGYIVKSDKNIHGNLAEKIEEAVNCKDDEYKKIIENAKETASKLTWENFAINLFNCIYQNEE